MFLVNCEACGRRLVSLYRPGEANCSNCGRRVFLWASVSLGISLRGEDFGEAGPDPNEPREDLFRLEASELL